jgi:hypothetical protein
MLVPASRAEHKQLIVTQLDVTTSMLCACCRLRARRTSPQQPPQQYMWPTTRASW